MLHYWKLVTRSIHVPEGWHPNQMAKSLGFTKHQSLLSYQEQLKNQPFALLLPLPPRHHKLTRTPLTLLVICTLFLSLQSWQRRFHLPTTLSFPSEEEMPSITAPSPCLSLPPLLSLLLIKGIGDYLSFLCSNLVESRLLKMV